MSTQKTTAFTATNMANKILVIRQQSVLLDADLAKLYGVTTKRLNEQVKRNIERFPPDFMFQLTANEKRKVVANCDHLDHLKYSRTNPYAYTEHGAIMAAGVLNTALAIEVSVLVVRTFIKLREILSTDQALKHKLTEVEHRLDGHDEHLQALIQTIQQLMEPPDPPKKRPIGFARWPDE